MIVKAAMRRYHSGMRDNWYTKRQKDKRKETIAATVWACTSALALVLWHFAFGKSFTWTDYQLISTPLEYGFYSALVFIGPELICITLLTSTSPYGICLGTFSTCEDCMNSLKA